MAAMSDNELDGLSERWAERLPGEDVSTVEPVARLGSVARLIAQFHRATLQPFGLELSDYQVLAALWSSDDATGMSPTQLAGYLKQTPAGMTKTLVRLESRKSVRRVQSKIDRRSVSVRLTAQGRRLAERACYAELVAQQDLMSEFSNPELARFDDLLKSLVEALGRD
jgi:DNA-binding MarR family transcriptional regulator